MVIASGATPEFIGLKTGEPPFAVLPKPETLFAARAARFRALAPDHSLAPYLGFLAIVCDAQQRLADATPMPPLDADAIARAFAHDMPPLSTRITADDGGAALVTRLIADLGLEPLDPGPRQALDRLAGLSEEARADLVVSVAGGAFPLEQLAEAAIVAAALQVWFAKAAAGLDAAKLKSIEDGVCPACGSAPVSSMVVNWPEAPAARFLCCSLCDTAWNYVRVKCTACASTKGISYRRIEGQDEVLAAEVCESCGGYAKHLIQEKAPLIDPFADDVASFGLDVLLREEGWKRTTINPFLLG